MLAPCDADRAPPRRAAASDPVGVLVFMGVLAPRNRGGGLNSLMKLRFENHPDTTVVRYSGTHGCKDEDHEHDRQVREYLRDKVVRGQTRFLLDVRDLRVGYPSGMGDLINSWASTRDEARCRVAVLWKPSPRPWPFDRWAVLSHVMQEAAETPRPAGVRPCWPCLFVDEDEARAFLLSDEPRATQSEQRP
jgi:hypothetical protein